MITIYTWQKIKTLKQEGFSIKKIARTLKISKNTVKRLYFHVAIPWSRPRALRALNAFGTARR